MPNYSEFQSQRNKAFTKTAEMAATKAIMIGADIFKAVLGFLKQMLFSFLGK
jgi:hypothetical protein